MFTAGILPKIAIEPGNAAHLPHQRKDGCGSKKLDAAASHFPQVPVHKAQLLSIAITPTNHLQ
jgi:hypothetical protein